MKKNQTDRAPRKTLEASTASDDAPRQMAHTLLPWFLTPRDTPNETRENFIQSLCIESDAGFVLRVSDLGHARTEQQRRIDAEYIVAACNSFPALVEALKQITKLGGNLPDEALEDRTGPNDAAARGMMYTGARAIAREALAKAESGQSVGEK